MSAAHKLLPNYSYDDYCHWEGRWELIDGIPFSMSPAPWPRHQSLSSLIQFSFISAIKTAKCMDCKVYDFIDLKINEQTILQPDVSIICGEVTKQFVDFAPALVVEILSPSSILKDRHTKFDIYQNYGIRYYVIVDPNPETIEVFELVDGAYLISESDQKGNFELHEGCAIEVDWEDVREGM